MNNKEKKFVCLTPFKMQVVQSFPFIDADFDALTNYELLCKVVEYLNITVDNVNLLNDDFQTLYSYVHDYFDNLDVQNEINNKLDAMAESGELTDIIAQYLELAGILTYDTVSDMKLADNLANGSIAKTLGYHTKGDNGGALYKVREVTNEDVINEGNIIALADDSLVAELVEKTNITVEMFGAVGDAITNDYTAFKNCFDYANLNKSNIILKNTSYKILGNRLTLKTNLFGNDAVIISNDNDSGVNLDEPIIHVVSDNEFSSTVIDNAFIFRTYPEHSNIWKRSGNTEASALGVVPAESNVKLNNKLLYDYFFDFSDPTELYRAIDKDIVIKDLIIDKTVVIAERTSYIKRNILIERDNVLLDGIKFYLNDSSDAVTPYLGLIQLNKCYNVRLNNCNLPAMLANSSYAFHTSYDVKTYVSNCYMNGVDDCWGATSSIGAIDIIYDKVNTNRIDAHEGFFGLTVKDSNIGKEGITLTGGRYANIIGCHFNGRRCVALREDFGSGFNGTIRLKNCDGSLSQGEIIYLKSNTDFDYGYTWKAPSIEIEDCDFTTSAGRLDILATTISTDSDLTWYSSTNTIKVNNITANKNLRLFNYMPLFFGDCEIFVNGLNLRGGFYSNYVTTATNYTIFVNANKCVIRYPKTDSMVRINGFYTNCEMLDLEFIHLNTSLCGCSLRERDSVTMGYTDSGKHLSMVNFGLLIKSSDITAWHENCYNYKAE